MVLTGEGSDEFLAGYPNIFMNDLLNFTRLFLVELVIILLNP